MDAIATIPYEYVPYGWGEHLRLVQESPLLPKSASDAQIANEVRIKVIWELVLHHVIKSWRSKHRIPYPRHLVKATEPVGNLAAAYFELCIQCHTSLPLGVYQNAGEWFGAIMHEFQMNDFEGLPQYEGKTSSLSKHRKAYEKLYCFCNPIDPRQSPHLHRLIQTSIKLLDGGKCDRFDKLYWQPFLNALAKWNTAKQSAEWTTVFDGKGKLWCREGRGKGKYLLMH